MAKNKKRDPRYTKSRAVKNSAKKAAATAVLQRQQLKEAKEREAGNKEPSIDTDTGDEAQNNVEESVASEEPVEEPGQELAPEREPVLDQGPADEEEPNAKIEKETANEEPPVKAKPALNLRKVTVRLDRLALNPDGSTKAKKKKAQDADLKGGSSPPEKRRRMTRSTAKVGCSSDGQVTDDEVTRYFARKKIGLTNAKLRHRGPRISKGHPSMAPKKVNSDATMKNKKGKTFLKDKGYLSLLEFKRSVTTSLLLYGLNAEIARKGDAPEARLMKEILLSAEPGAKRRKDRLSVPDEIRFSQVGIHHPIFVENRGRCEWCQATTERRPNGHTKESRPFSQCSMCKIFLCLSKKRNCFLEFHDDRILDPTKAAAETVLAVDPEEEIAVQTVETDPLGIYPSSDSSDDSDFDVLNNPANDGVLLDEDEWLK
ncbi:hypothetical protein DAPPUDRAFT_328982 [Daphnia pulex]|uniref:Uncharacterized protein n=1 Tax=Daphnia pulex TaxID=6669 RepID=E9HFB3_DAPPU|nr:hypothetical protein DAPPUDRAFT_328982 [Daphnia pulex]|eukprot:EFX69589.1 hypothetical protein DAPPUDRAFT_328982 [Daphnia pulex]